MNARKSLTRKRPNPQIADAIASVMLAALAPQPIEIIITRHNGAWCYVMGSHRTPILHPDNHSAFVPFHDGDSPIEVAKYINRNTAGPINVIWI